MLGYLLKKRIHRLLSAPAHAPLLLAFRSRNLAGKNALLTTLHRWSACLLSQFAFIARRPWRELAMAGLLMGSGGILFCIHSLPLHPSDLRHFELRNAQQVTLRGQIEATPKRHIRSDPAGSKIWFETDMRQAPFSALKVGSWYLVKFGSELWVFPLQKSPKELCLHPRNAQTPFTTLGPHGPSSARFSPTCGYLYDHGNRFSPELANPFYIQPGWQHVFEILQKNAENQLAVGLPIEDDVLALQRAMGISGSRSSLPPVLLEPFKQTATPCICLPSADYMSRWLPDYATVVFV